jgi:putative PEP-CTERM system histidine kinase
VTITVLILSLALSTTLGVAVVARFVDVKGTPIRAFGRCLLALSLCLAGLIAVVVARSSSLAAAGAKVAALGVVLLPTQLILFSKRKVYRVGSYLFGLIFAYLALTDRIIVLPNRVTDGALLLLRPAANYFVIYLILIFLLVLIGLEGVFRSLRKYQRKDLRVLVAGGMVAFIYGIVSACEVFLTQVVTANVVKVAAAATTVSTFLFAALMLRIRAIQENLIVSREVVYSSVMFLVVGGILISIGIAAKILATMGADLGVFFSVLAAFAFVLLIAAVITSVSLKERLKAFIDRNLFRGTYDYRDVWSRFSDKIAQNLELSELVHRLLSFVRDLLAIDRAAMLLLDRESNEFVLKEVVDAPPPETNVRISASSDFADWLWRWGKPISVERLVDRSETRVMVEVHRSILEALGIVVFVPLIARGEFVGIMGLGKRKGDRSYRQVDFELLEIIADHAAVAILNSRLNEELISSKELESFYKVSSFVVHDLRNAVSSLSMTLDNAEKHIANRSFQKDMLRTIAGSVAAMKRLMSRLSSFDGGLALNREPVNIDHLVLEVLGESGICASETISVSTDLQAETAAMMDRGHLRRLLQNLVLNAIEAMPSGGELKIRTRLVPPEGSTTDDTEVMLQIEVQDSGVGMTQQFMTERLFKPFASTKEKGLGLGLFQCREIAQAHGGGIDVTSQPGRGTTFRVSIPCQKVATVAEEERAVA